MTTIADVPGQKKTFNHPMIFQINKMNLTSIKEYLTYKKVSVF